MPRGYCLYPQDTTVDEFLDDGKTPNPQRCPYRTRWKPYVTPPPASNLCCQRAYVPKKARDDLNNSRIPPTHVNFTDERLPAPSPPQRPRVWTPNRNCPPGSLCLPGRCTSKFVKRFDREIQKVCSNKHRCVLPQSVAWKRSGCDKVPAADDDREGKEVEEEKIPEVKEEGRPIIKKVTHRRKGCDEFPELNEGEPEPRGWCPAQRCYRHTEGGKRVCRSAPPIPSPYSIEEDLRQTDSDSEKEEGERHTFIPEPDPCRSI